MSKVGVVPLGATGGGISHDAGAPSESSLESQHHGNQRPYLQEFHPTTGGTEASYVEGDGEPGDKGQAGGPDSSIGGISDFGVYEQPKHQNHGIYPEAMDDPDCGGPPLGETVGKNGYIDAFAKSNIGPPLGGGGYEPSDPESARPAHGIGRPVDTGALGRGR